MAQPPAIYCERHHPTLSVSDIQAAISYYTDKLGFTKGFEWGDPVTFACMNFGNVSIHLNQLPVHAGNGNVFFVVDNVNVLHDFHQENGVEISFPLGDRDYSLRDYSVLDPFGNTLVFGQYIYNIGEPIYIERVDLPVRLEKRLAALLYDLAEYKGMTVDSTLEEMLLHSFEVVGDSVASPHTKSTLAYIADLKKKHGIDYNTHGSYLFTEKE